MSPDNNKKQKILEKVRALLAKASSTTFPEEAQSFREKADELMVAYAIEEWQLSADTPLGRPQPEMRIFDMSWFTSRNPFYQDLWFMMNQTARHCRCVCVYWDWVPRKMKVVGLPADLDYFDLLFTQLMLEHAKRLEPKPDPDGEVGHEVYKLRQAGMPWPRITELIYKANLVKLTEKERAVSPVSIQEGRWMHDDLVNPFEWTRMSEYVKQSIKNRLANFNRRYVRQNGLQHERNYVNPRVYQRSFSQGFTDEISYRMTEMQHRSEQEAPGDNHAALALRDIRQVVIQWVNENYPKPEVKDSKRKSRAISREVAFDISAYETGKREGRNVNISAQPSRGLRNQKEIER